MSASHMCEEDGGRSPEVDTDPERRDLPHRDLWLGPAEPAPRPLLSRGHEGGRGCWLVSPQGADSIFKPQLGFSCLVGLGRA